MIFICKNCIDVVDSENDARVSIGCFEPVPSEEGEILKPYQFLSCDSNAVLAAVDPYGVITLMVNPSTQPGFATLNYAEIKIGDEIKKYVHMASNGLTSADRMAAGNLLMPAGGEDPKREVK